MDIIVIEGIYIVRLLVINYYPYYSLDKKVYYYNIIGPTNYRIWMAWLGWAIVKPILLALAPLNMELDCENTANMVDLRFFY